MSRAGAVGVAGEGFDVAEESVDHGYRGDVVEEGLSLELLATATAKLRTGAFEISLGPCRESKSTVTSRISIRGRSSSSD